MHESGSTSNHSCCNSIPVSKTINNIQAIETVVQDSHTTNHKCLEGSWETFCPLGSER